MRRFARYTFVFCLVAAFVMMPVASGFAAAGTTVESETPSAPVMAADLIGVRPLGIASTVLGLVGYVVSLPFSIPGGNSDKVWTKMVAEPAGYTFKRPLGKF